MSERQILFSAPMVRAILEGRKTQTRRVFNPQPRGDVASLAHIGTFVKTGRALFAARDAARQPVNAFPIGSHSVKDDIACPYGKAGGHLWVRETLRLHADGNWHRGADDSLIELAQDDERVSYMIAWAHHQERDYCPSIHMPRFACRLVLELTKVRVERVQDISDDDAIAEGIEPSDVGDANEEAAFNAAAYAELWDALNKKRGFGWDINPWVWVLEFKRHSAR